MGITRRDFLKASSAVAAAFGLKGPVALAAAAPSSPSVVWLQAQGCSGCSVSLLNSIYYATVDGLLLNTLSLDYHPTLMAAAGADAVTAARMRSARRATSWSSRERSRRPTGGSTAISGQG